MSLYFRIAFKNIQKNRRLFVPQILSTAGLMAMTYIIKTILLDPNLTSIKGGSFLPAIMSIGLVVVGILTFVLTLYINSFLMKQRTGEFGLYNVLGLEKRHIARIIFIENGISTLISLVLGSVLGIGLYKLCTLIISNIFKVETILGFDYIKIPSLLPTVLIFVGLFLFTFIINRIRIARMNPIELLATKHTGEKEPKVKLILLILGLATLGGGYYLALSAENPLAALNTFFIAVPLVIVGTYFLFITGSIAILKALKKKKSFFYTKKHMISVSGLLYRMKQNAVGLGSITILATCVVVMISTTISLYAGIDDKVKSTFQHDFTASGHYYGESEDTEGYYYKEIPFNEDDVEAAIYSATKKNDVNVTYLARTDFLEVIMDEQDGKFKTTVNISSDDALAKCSIFYVIPEKLYTDLTGVTLDLKSGEIGKCDLAITNTHIGDKAFTFDGKTYSVAKNITSFPISIQSISVMKGCYGIVVPNDDSYDFFINICEESVVSSKQSSIIFDVDNKNVDYKILQNAIREDMSNLAESREPNKAFRTLVDSSWSLRDELYGMLGGLLFLGIILSIVFVFATALIIYYKQISEGYEDRQNFQILQKVGLTKKEVKKTIKDQILLVFFLPLLVAAVHCTVAFPILTKLLAILFLASKTLFLLCTLGAFAVFALLYVIIYSITSNTYYKIVK